MVRPLQADAPSTRTAQAGAWRQHTHRSIDTLIRIVDENGGFTIIPEMHLPFLTDKQRENIRKIEGNYLSQRRVSLYIKDDYIRQRMLNTIVDTLKAFMPKGMMGEGILKYGIKL